MLSDFRPEPHGEGAHTFKVAVTSADWRGDVRASSFMAPDLGDFFHALARDWTGWEGARHWGTLEGEFCLCATADRLGHVRLVFTLCQPHTGLEWQLTGALEIEAGALQAIAEQVSAVWRQNTD